MKNDFNYIIKRIIIGVAIGLILFNIKSCNVNATSYNMTPTGCTVFYNSGNTSRTGTVTSGNYGAYNNMFSCVTTSSNVYYITQYTYTLPNQWTSNAQFGTVSFYTLGQQESLVRIKTGGVNYACEITTGVLVEAIATSGTHGQYYNYIVCPNVPINNGRSYEIDINAYSSNASLSSDTVAPSIISRDFNFTINESTQVSNAINNQTQQQHQDSQAIQSAITNDSVNVDIEQNEDGSFNINNSNIVLPGILTSVLTIPVGFYQELKSNLTTNCVNLSLTSSNLPFGNKINYGSGVQIKCIRKIIEEDMNFTYYETIGSICGGCFLLVYLIKKGKHLLNMSKLKEDDDSLWGGIS